MDLGRLSLVMTICLPEVCRSLKVWKKLSRECSLPAMNWISSMRRTSVWRYLSRKSSTRFSRRAVTKSLVKCSALA